MSGYGETKDRLSSGEHGKYLLSVMNTLSISKPIILSPSMSGGFSIPYLLSSPDEISGYIPVAPVNSELIKDAAGIKVSIGCY